jgi:citrate synthase
MTAGLAGIVATSTQLSRVDGESGQLILAGYSVEDLAPNASFEEVVYLLLHGRIPGASELTSLRAALAERREMPDAAREILREAVNAKLAPMDALRMAVATLSLLGQEDPFSDAMTAIASFPTIVGAYRRLQMGEMPIRFALTYHTQRTIFINCLGPKQPQRGFGHWRRTSTPFVTMV